MISKYFAKNLQQQLKKVTQHGFCIMDNFLSKELIFDLVNETHLLDNLELMQEAGTGQKSVTINKHLRGDSIYWLNQSEASHAQQVYFTKMEKLRLGLNQHLFLGLFSLESHLAFYPKGAGYKKHIDKFNDKNKIKSINQIERKISCILYLNQHWIESDGGKLRLYLNQVSPLNSNFDALSSEPLQIDISPVGGRLVIFLSDTFYHEVLPTMRDRMSLTGWFLNR